MLSVVEQRAGHLGALAVTETTAAETQHLSAGNDQHSTYVLCVCDRSLRSLMLSVVEQRAGHWGSLAVTETTAAETQHLSAGDDQHSTYVDGDQQSPVDISSYDLPSVTIEIYILRLRFPKRKLRFPGHQIIWVID